MLQKKLRGKPVSACPNPSHLLGFRTYTPKSIRCRRYPLCACWAAAREKCSRAATGRERSWASWPTQSDEDAEQGLAFSWGRRFRLPTNFSQSFGPASSTERHHDRRWFGNSLTLASARGSVARDAARAAVGKPSHRVGFENPPIRSQYRQPQHQRDHNHRANCAFDVAERFLP